MDPGEHGPALSAEPRARPRWRRVALRLVAVVVAVEVLLRVATFVAYGRNPYYLFYGFQGAVSQVNVSPWSVYQGQYYKYPAHYELQGAAGQAGETAHTNNLGFRGPDFEPEKPAGTFRVFCTGGSSTFGFHNDDDETYPYYLAELLAADPATAHVEVVNAGFPYYNTATILGLVKSELVDYGPDVVTLYSGYNDTSWPLDVGLWYTLVNRLQQHSITCFVLKETVLTDKRIYKIMNRLGLGGGSADLERVQADVERVAARFRANVEELVELSKREGFELVVIRQPITTAKTNPELAGMSYEDEYRAVLAKAAAGGFLSRFDVSMIRHHRLVAELDAIAEDADLPVVDNIALLDEDRSLLASWVHLRPEANRRLAEALAPVIAALAER
jgi:lysophospholipase L1-like esterase